MSWETSLTQLAGRLPPWRSSAYVLGMMLGAYTGFWCLQELTRAWVLSARRRRHPVRSRADAACTDDAWLGHADEKARQHIVARFQPFFFLGRSLNVAPAERRGVPSWGGRVWRYVQRPWRSSHPPLEAQQCVHPVSMEQLWGLPAPAAKPWATKAAAPGRGCSYTWLAPNTCLVQMHGLTLLTEPVSMSTPRDPCTMTELLAQGHIDVILVMAHLDLSLVPHVPRTTRWIVPRGVGAYLTRRGVDAAQVIELTWWDETHAPFTVPVREAAPASVRDAERRLDVAAVPTSHTSGHTLCQSYVVRCAARGQRTLSFFLGGDSGYHQALSASIGHMYGPFEGASFPIDGPGDLGVRVLMDGRQAMQAAQDLGASQCYGRPRSHGAWADTQGVQIVPRGKTQVVASV
ncbi:N-acetylphosphatidylethanolamine-hydrolyzing phospholipase D [Malassezia equina]|uniref:N-acetylphosphatidylethanolamine-hydrolyzing phospholipase D n=1 Tax=Malassezia equina TaxID=1381935 RepID=A0AAF0EDE5_9BASI|nr:N-acetylphosphatidylethanolamine-hydrolyzing phospholipase D [Malassezia equina]